MAQKRGVITGSPTHPQEHLRGTDGGGQGREWVPPAATRAHRTKLCHGDQSVLICIALACRDLIRMIHSARGLSRRWIFVIACSPHCILASLRCLHVLDSAAVAAHPEKLATLRLGIIICHSYEFNSMLSNTLNSVLSNTRSQTTGDWLLSA